MDMAPLMCWRVRVSSREQGVSMSDVFVLGAGFSKAISGTMPTLQQLSESILPTLQDRDPTLANRLVRMGKNVELWMSYLSQPQPWLRVEQNQYNASVAGVIRRLLRSRIDDLVTETRTVPEWVRALVAKWHRQQTTVLTLNYDTLVERVARGVMVRESDGTERGLLPCDLYPSYFGYAGARAFGAWSPTEVKTLALLKLHGSTNWHYSGQPNFYGETILWTKTATIESESERQEEVRQSMQVADKEILIIPPVTEKTTYFKNETVGRLWRDAAEALSGARRVVVIGYSLPECDFGMRAFLGTVIQKSGVEVLVVDIDAHTPERYRQLLRSSNINRSFACPGEPLQQFARVYCRDEI